MRARCYPDQDLLRRIRFDSRPGDRPPQGSDPGLPRRATEAKRLLADPAFIENVKIRFDTSRDGSLDFGELLGADLRHRPHCRRSPATPASADR